MIKCKKVPFKANRENINRLFGCNRLSAEVWNNVLTISKCYSLNNDQKTDLPASPSLQPWG